MITTAQQIDVQGLMKLWERSFGDSMEYIGLFFANRFDPAKTLVDVRDGFPVAMLFLLDMDIQSGSRVRRGYYLYAACTLPEYRNQGIMGALLSAARVLAKERGGQFIALKPANEALQGYYSRFGYKPFFYHKHVEVAASPGQISSFAPLTVSKMLEAQHETLRLHGGVRWSREALSYALREQEFTQGSAAYVESGAKLLTLFYRCLNGRLWISDCLGELSLLPHAVYAIGEQDAGAEVPIWAGGGENLKTGGMLLWLAGGPLPPNMSLNFTLG